MNVLNAAGVCAANAWVTVPEAAGANEEASAGTIVKVCENVWPVSVVTVTSACAGVEESFVKVGSASTKELKVPGELFIASDTAIVFIDFSLTNWIF